MRAKTIGQKLNATTESNIDQALQLAAHADALRVSGNYDPQDKPLLGVPFSVKDCITQKGFDCTMGFPSNINKPYSKDSYVVTALIQAGAIPFVRSNIPQALLTIESENEIFGICKNPHNLEKTAGGSSGGEGSLIASCCSPFGVGSDIGGSSRIPAAFNGIVGFKPTNPRLCYFGSPQVSPIGDTSQQTLISATYGPLAKTAKDIELIMKVIADPKVQSEATDFMPILEWKQQDISNFNSKRHRYGYFKDIKGILNITEEQGKAVDKVVDALKNAGHDVVEIEIPDVFECYETILRTFISSGNNVTFFDDSLHGIQIIPAYTKAKIMASVPNFVKYGLSYIASWLGASRVALNLRSIRKFEVSDIFSYQTKMNNQRANYHEYLAKQGVSIVISPAIGVPAFSHHISGDFLLYAFYCSFFSSMGVPAGVIPTHIMEKGDSLNCEHNDIFTKPIVEDLKSAKNLPLAVQVSSTMYQDEKVIGAMQYIQNLIGVDCLLEPSPFKDEK